jgi:tetrapyrrole methylase family protein/MazG family protein
MKVWVVGLGPAGPELVTAETLAAIERVPVRYLRTTRHPAASLLDGAPSFDHLYESADRIDDVYAGIVDALVAAAAEHGEVLYAVPGSPRVAERSVALLVADGRVADGRAEVVVLPALSFLDLAWTRLGIDPLAEGVRIVDGHRFAVEAAGERGPLLVAQCDTREVLSEIKLAVGDDPPATATVIQRLGLPDETVVEVAWEDLDRAVEPDHLTSVWLPELAAPVAAELVRFSELVRTLRRECPWDRQQTHRSLTRHLLEETYEVLEAIEALDEPSGYEHLEEELGDLLFQVVFHATLGAEAGQFTLADVARGVHDKLVGRHPHVFAGLDVAGADEVVQNWEQIKKAEKGRDSVMEGIPGELPSLLYALKVQKKAASLGIHADGLPLEQVLDEAALADALWALVAAARTLDLDPEAALRARAAAFRDHVRAQESPAD